VIVVDASVLIAHLEPADRHHERATRLLLAHQADEFAATNLKLPDCCVIHAAGQHHAAVATFDPVLADQARRLNLSTID
jgi:predicted nucleic acid-binding protein